MKFVRNSFGAGIRSCFIILFICTINPIFSQKFEDYKPYGCFQTETIKEVEFDYNSVKKVSSVTNTQSDKMGLTFAHQFTTDLTPDNSGTWETKDNGDKVWYLEISSPDAYTINLIFDRYNLPEGAKLFIYNEDMSQVLGAFTSSNNNKNGILATAPVTGDKVIVEYQEPENVEFSGELMIGAVNHDYLGVNKYISQLKSSTGFKGSGSCEEDVSCYDPNDTIDVRRAALKLLVDGVSLCSATLVNNTNEDGTPYVITGAHCFTRDETAETALVYFNYETPHCSTDQIDGVKTLTLSGANMVVYVPELDIALIEMNDVPDESYRPYYAGWSLDTSPNGPYYCFHHPEGDVKKVSLTTTNLKEASLVLSGKYATESNVHWLVSEWGSGVTEPGSSGSALYDANFRLIGTLTAGEADCSYPYNDYFTRFCKDWDLRSDDTAQFKVWLDPTNSGTDYLDGYDPYADNGVVRLSNVEETDSAGIIRYNNKGYISGHNNAGIELFAEEFAGVQNAVLKGVYISPSQSTSSSDQTIDIMVWKGTDVPNTLVYTQSDVPMSKLLINKESYISFNQSVTVNGTFFVGYKIDYSGSPIDSFAVYHNTYNSEKINNTMFVHDGSEWQLASDYYNIGNTSLWLDILAESVSYGVTDSQSLSSETEEGLIIHPNPIPQNTSIVYLNTNNNYVTWCSLYQMDGRLLQKCDINENDDDIVMPLNFSNWPGGTYLLKFKLKDGSVVVKKIVKE